jgi:hypothetical protein
VRFLVDAQLPPALVRWLVEATPSKVSLIALNAIRDRVNYVICVTTAYLRPICVICGASVVICGLLSATRLSGICVHLRPICVICGPSVSSAANLRPICVDPYDAGATTASSALMVSS